MNRYETLDRLILEAISNEFNPYENNPVWYEAERLRELEKTTGAFRHPMRIVDHRLQHLRKKGSVYYVAKGFRRGWHIKHT